MKPRDVITDHAVLRFIERRYGLDVEAEREKVRKIVTPYLTLKTTVLKTGSLKFILRDGYCVTVLAGDMATAKTREPAHG